MNEQEANIGLPTHANNSKECTLKKRRLFFYTSTKVHFDAQGVIRSYNPLMSNDEWQPFLRVFDEIIIFARVDASDRTDQGHSLSYPEIKIQPIPYYEGASGLFRRLPALKRFLTEHLTDHEGYYGLWGPGVLAPYIARRIRSLGAPLLVRVIGDPVAVIETIVPWPLSRILSSYIRRGTLATLKRASAVSYVTLRSLQESYPPPPESKVLARTNLKFSSELQGIPKKRYSESGLAKNLSIVAVGSQEQNYKGHDLLLEAFAELQELYPLIKLTLVGSGRLHEKIQAQARSLGLRNVTFIERLSTNVEVAKEVVSHDLFIMPSRTEGMPKALLEAMLLGVFSLGSNVGGIPEALEAECVFRSNSSRAIVETVSNFVESPHEMLEQVKHQRRQIEIIQKHHSGPEVMEKFLSDWVSSCEKR